MQIVLHYHKSVCISCGTHKILFQVAYTIAWTAISSELSYYTAVFGPHMLLLLNAAYFLPSVPVLLLQMVWDHQFDRWFGVAASTAARLVVGTLFY